MNTNSPGPLTPGTTIELLSLRVGHVQALGREALPSAIDKRPLAAARAITRLGLAGDQQADGRHHGGVDKALHHYPAEHYPAWRRALPRRASAFEIGGFGENLSTLGLTEDNVCLGDVFRLGAATLQVSQGRSPCRKLNLRFDLPDMVERVLSSGRTGWYYRVLEEGAAGPADSLCLVQRPHPEWPIVRLFQVLFQGREDRAALAELAGLPSLAANWRERAASGLGKGRIEG